MPKALAKIDENPSSSAQKLIDATLDIWEKQGRSGISARAIANNAGLPVSAIYYYFGDLERLLESTQDTIITDAEKWFSTCLKNMQGHITGPDALAPLLSTIIDDWCEMQRIMAFAERECQLMALRDPKYQPLCARWFALWLSFWEEICHRLNLPIQAGRMTSYFVDGVITLHLLRWRRPADRAALDELCRGWAAWISGRTTPPAPWNILAREEAIAAMPPQPEWDEATAAIAASCASVIARLGAPGLTHRAVAADAGMTLGVVSHKFRTSADLLRAAFETIYRRLVYQGKNRPPSDITLTAELAMHRIDTILPPRDEMLATYELMTASARHSEFQAFSGQLRYLRGRTSHRYLQILRRQQQPVSTIDAMIFSCWQSGRIRAYHCCGLTPEQTEGKPSDTAQILDLLGPPAA